MITYLHPISGGIVLLLLAYAGSLGLRGRNDRRRGDELLGRHARVAPWAFGLALASWAAGVVTTWLWRGDLEVAGSNHFKVGGALAVVLIGGWLTARRIGEPWARAAHPWFGVAALLLAAAQTFFGLQITP